MSSLLDRFVRQLQGRGLTIQGPRDGDPDDKLYLIGPQAERTPEIMAALKQFKPDLVKRFGRKPKADESLAYGSEESNRLDAYAQELMREEGSAGE